MLNKIDLKESFFLFIIALFIFILPIPGTTSIRYLAEFILLCYAIYFYLNDSVYVMKQLKNFKTPLIILLLLVCWMIYQAIFISQDTIYTLYEIKKFLTTIVLFIIAMVFGLQRKYNNKLIVNTIFIAGFMHIVIQVSYSLYLYVFINNMSHMNIRIPVLQRVDEISFYFALIYAIYLSEIFNRLILKKRYLIFKNNIFYILFFIFTFSIYLSGMRLGLITFVISNIFFMLYIIYKIKVKYYFKIILSFLILMFLYNLVSLSLSKDKRWENLTQTLKIVKNDNSLYWLNRHKYPCPTINNRCVDLSNYLRPAQQLNGYKILVNDFPFGTGYSRRAYKEAVNIKYNDGYGHPHSGMLNFILGVGFPGIVLYTFFLISVMKTIYDKKLNFMLFATILILASYHLRSLVDMNLQDHILQMFMFIFGIFTSASLSNIYDKRN